MGKKIATIMNHRDLVLVIPFLVIKNTFEVAAMKRHMLVLFFVLVPIILATDAVESTVIGMVRVNETDENDNVMSVYLETDDQDYLLKNNAQARALIQHVDSKISATGYLEEDDEGNTILNIINFKVLEEE